MGKCKFFRRFVADECGSHTTEMALAIAFFALIAGFGLFAFGDALADFFNKLGSSFAQAGDMVPGFTVNPMTNGT